MKRDNPSRAAIAGFLIGSVLFFISAYKMFRALLPPPDSVFIDDGPPLAELERMRTLDIVAWSGMFAIVGGVVGAISAVSFKHHGFRFGLRAMLIATAVLATLLGIITYIFS